MGPSARIRLARLDRGDFERERSWRDDDLRLSRQRTAGDGPANGRDDRNGERPSSATRHRASDLVSHDRLHTRAQIRAAHAGHAWQPQSDRLPTDLENAFGVVARPAARSKHRFVAGAFALVDEPRLDPPHRRMEPEERFDRHVDRGSEIVMAADMAPLVRDQRAQLRGRQAFDDALGKQQPRTTDADDARFRHRGG